MDGITIRITVPADLDAVVQVEAACFPATETADRKSSKGRLDVFPQSFLVVEDGSRIIGSINGTVTNERIIGDEMFEDISLHEPQGAYQSISGLDVIEECRHRGVASYLMKAMIERARSQGRRRLILTCKERLIGYYETFGYANMDTSKPVHGGAVWYDTILGFQQMKITLVTVGKIKERYFEDTIREYAKRLSRYRRLDIIQVADEKTSDGAGEAIERQIEEKEGQRIPSNIKDGAYVIALAIEGKMLISEKLVGRIQRLGVDGVGHIAFIMGGSLGSSGDAMKWADFVLSFPEMTFPRQPMRVVLLEQVYRNYRIITGEPYHKQWEYEASVVNESG